MNTIKSTWVGWGTLCVAGGGAYYFAKRAINADRYSRHDAAQRRKEAAARQEADARAHTPKHVGAVHGATNSAGTGGIPDIPPPKPASGLVSSALRDDVGSPSEEAGHDPAPTRHEPNTEAERAGEKGKYEATQAFRSRKGDRFS